MYVKSVRLSDILSFGPRPQELTDLKRFNLFIGINGAGKTNALRLLEPMNLRLRPVSAQETQAPRFEAQLPPRFAPDRFYYKQDWDVGNLEIRFESVQNEAINEHYLQFENGVLTAGHPNQTAYYSKKISSDWTDAEFVRSLSYIRAGEQFHEYAFVIFGLRYIFQRDYILSEWGCSS